MTTFSGQIDVPRLQDIIGALFNIDELHELCELLSMDYEDLAGSSKTRKVLELVRYHDRRNELDKLIDQVKRLRPHAGVNMQKLFGQVIPPTDPQHQVINSLIDQLRRYIKRLNEWKELHNRMNTLLNIFDPFGKQIERLDAKEEKKIDLRMLQYVWQAVKNNIVSLLDWAKAIVYIGEPFQELDDGFRGAKWAIDLNVTYASLHDHLLSPPHNGIVEASGSNAWWQTLLENKSRLDDTIKRFLFLADDELRKAASDLYALSSEALWS